MFLSHAGEDAEAVRLLARRMKEAGFAVWLDVDRMRVGESWMACQERALRQAGAWILFVGRLEVGAWLDRESRLALQRSQADPSFRVIPVLGRGADPDRLPLWLSRHPGLDLRGRMPEPADLRRILATVFEQSPQRGQVLEDGESPFLGLTAFGPDRSHLFFGRDEEVEQLLEAMVRSPFLALVGQAGSGKSSLLQAGLLPALRRGRFYAKDRWVDRWRIACMRPKDDPFRELAKVLPDLGPAMEPLARQEVRRKAERRLNKGVDGLADCVKALAGAGTRSLIVVDQFEELFTQTERPERRRRFVDSLIRAMGAAHDRQVHILLAMRADWYGHAFEHPKLPDLLARNQFPLTLPHPAHIKEIVERPTHWAGARLQQGLLPRLLDEFAEPLTGLGQLQFAMSRLWRARRDETLSARSLEEIGGLSRVVGQCAEEIFEGLTESERRATRRLFEALCLPGHDAGDSSRSVRLTELLESWQQRREMRSVIERFVEGGVLRQEEDAIEGVDRIDLAHSLLMKHWPRLGDWVDSLREGQARERQDLLLGGAPIDQDSWASPGAPGSGDAWTQESWVVESEDRPTPTANFFTTPEPEWKPTPPKSPEDGSDPEPPARRQLLGLAHVARTYEAESRGLTLGGGGEDHACELAGLSASALERDPLLALILAVESGRVQETREGIEALRAALRSAHLEAVLPHEGPVQQAVFSADGSRIVTSLADGTVRIFERLTGKEMHVLGGGELPGNRSFVSLGGCCILCCDALGMAQLFDAESGRLLYTLDESQEGLRDVVFAADAHCFLTICQDGEARVYETRSGRRLMRMKGPKGWLVSATFHPDGTRLLTYGSGNDAFVWDCRKGVRLASLTGHTARIETAIFSRDGATLFTGAADNTLRIWDLESGRQRDVLKGHGGTVWDLDLSPDGRLLSSAAQDGAARIWDLAFERQPVLLEGHGDWVKQARFTPDGSRVLTASLDGKVRIFDVDTGQLLGLLTGHDNWVTSVQPSPDGRSCVSASKDGSARLWSASGDGDLAVLLGHRGEVSWGGFNRDGQRVISASHDGTARIWGLGEGETPIVLRGHEGPVFAAAFSPDGRKAVTACRDGHARLFDATNARLIHELHGHRGSVDHARFNASGNLVLTAGEDRSARIWSVETGQVVTELWGHRARIESAAFCRGDLRVVTSGNDATARVWDPKTGEEIHVFRGHEGTIPYACFSPDASLVLTASHDGTARLWNVITGQEEGVLWGHEAGVLHAAFHPSGMSCLTASNDGTVRHWDVRTRKELLCYEGHGTPAVHVVYSPDGTRMLSAGYDGTARLVDLSDGRELACLRGHRGLVASARFSHDGRRVVTAGSDGSVRLFVIEFDDLLELAESRLPLTLSREERESLLSR